MCRCAYSLLFAFIACLCTWLPAQMPLETITIPGTQVSFQMVQLPAGTFQMGSPANEPDRGANEGLHQVQLSAFWIGIHEVTWDEFMLFQFRNQDSDAPAGFQADAVARPTPPYFDFTYGRGRAGKYPAATMTQQAALRYCQWLSDKTGAFYRLPTEAEWEYACRAGTTTAYSWGNDPKAATEYAWFYDNSTSSYQKAGSKKPNPWGIYDMHGNVAEWTLDFYVEDYFQRLDSNAVQPAIPPLKKHSRTVRGGSFEDPVKNLRSAARLKSAPQWQARDPQIPKSKWWNPDSPFVGFRIVRDSRAWSKAERDAFFQLWIKD